MLYIVIIQISTQGTYEIFGFFYMGAWGRHLKAHSQVWENFWYPKPEESPLKMMKNAFYFTSKALSILKVFKFLSWLFGHIAEQVDNENKVNFKFCDVTAWLTIVLHILCNMSRIKGNQTMKFGQLIECNMRNIFLEKSYTKYGGETILRPFSEKLKLSISLDQ